MPFLFFLREQFVLIVEAIDIDIYERVPNTGFVKFLN